MNYEKIESRLNEVKKKFKKNQESWVKIPGFWNYEISTLGRIKSLSTVEKRKCPRSGIMKKYIRKEAILKPLFTGPNRRWVSARISVKQGIHKQVSLAKLLLSSFLNMKLEKLPHSVYFINNDSHSVALHNLTFIRANKK